MSSLRKTISRGVSACVAAVALSVIASAPAASGGYAHARPFLTDGTRMQVRAVDRPARLLVTHVQSTIDVSSALALTRDGNVRVVVESSRPASARRICPARENPRRSMRR